jgi:hypothetical protein
MRDDGCVLTLGSEPVLIVLYGGSILWLMVLVHRVNR